jgi:hypothetical protein
MKTLIPFIFLLIGCSGGGGSSAPTGSGNGITTPPTCKSIYSTWQSDVDQEAFDFTTLDNATNPDYQFTADDGATCGYANNPLHSVTAQLVPATNQSWDYLLKLHADLALGGQCGYYANFAGSKDLTAVIYETGCNQIQICLSTGTGACKLFH